MRYRDSTRGRRGLVNVGGMGFPPSYLDGPPDEEPYPYPEEDDMAVCSVCGKDWMEGWNHSIWCGGFGRPHGRPVPREDAAHREQQERGGC